jgi:hypothetical protein
MAVVAGATYRLNAWHDGGAVTNGRICTYLIPSGGGFLMAACQGGPLRTWTAPSDNSVPQVQLYATTQNATVASGSSVYWALPRLEWAGY